MTEHGGTDYEARYRAVYAAGGERFYPREPSCEFTQFLQTSRIPPGRALVLGCGEGRNIAPLLDHGWRVIGLDSAPSGLIRAQLDYPLVAWCCADATERIPLADATQDLVVVINLLHLLTTVEARLRVYGTIHRVLQPGGHVYLENNGQLTAATVTQLPGGVVEPRTIQTATGQQQIPLRRLPTVLLNGATLRSELEGSGLAVERMWSGTFQHPDTARPQMLAIARKFGSTLCS